MLLSCKFIPENIKLWTNAYVFSDLANIGDRIIVNNDLKSLRIIWSQNTC